MFRFLVLLCLLLPGMGCSTLPATGDSAVRASAGNKLDVIGQTPVGASFALDQQLYQVVNEYTAASGRVCRNLLEQAGATQRVACRGQNSHWYLRQVLTQSHSVNAVEVPLSVTTRQLEVDAPVGEVVKLKTAEPAPAGADLQSLPSVAVAENENLWRFAKRVTGNALNWQAIADINGIVDVNSLRPGQKLRIPAQLRILARAGTQVANPTFDSTPTEGS